MILGTVNGYPVLATGVIPNCEGFKTGRRVILVDQGEFKTRQRYVVAEYVSGEDGWHHGDYITDWADALARFTARLLSRTT